MPFGQSVIVLDASAAVDLVLRRGFLGAWVAERVLSADDVHAPHLIDVEVAAALRRWSIAGSIAGSVGRRALQTFALLPLERWPATPLLPRVWELRRRISAADATYVALAETLRAPLVTTDQRLARAGGHRAAVVVPGETA
jgi:predicted nucleic acid-binding protein